MDYRETLNLPKTDFPMKADLVAREPRWQEQWAAQDLHGRLRRQAAGRPKYILHDGPPYANGDVHLGTALNKISKDLVVRYKQLRGFDAPFVPGWDCHGMPIEHKVVESLPEAERADRMRVRAECRRYAERYVDKQRAQFKRLGITADWEHPYLTMHPSYQAAIVRVFGELATAGYIYRGLKPVYWCTACQSALAEAEVEYEDHASPSITVAFDLVGRWPAALGERPAGRVRVLIWTTTPWTLPANRAVAVHPDHVYVLAESQGEHFVLAKELVETNARLLKRSFRVVAEAPGADWAGAELAHPFLDRRVPVILGTHVTLDSGTGAVHTAPGHGQEDFLAGKEYGLEVFNPVGPDGRFTAEFPPLQGVPVSAANPRVVDWLKEKGALLHAEELTHAYPHCWRHHVPVIFRATEQWFLNVDKDGFRQKVLSLIDRDVAWFPPAAQNRIASMVAARPDWCLSRQRAWGVPVPVFYCRECREPLMQGEVFSAVAGLVERENADAWFTTPVERILPPGTRCAKCGAQAFDRETDILDVWFDSGVSHAAVTARRPELAFPSDLYLEGSDQHRGWFQVSLLTSAATTGRAPYRAVVTHGYTVDGDGRKMSKSLGNFITAEEAIRRYGGADIVRLWVASENVQSDVRFSEEIFKRTVDAYRRIRNTLRFALGNLADFTPAHALPVPALGPLDRLLLHRLHRLTAESAQACDRFEFHRFFQLLHSFCSADLSAFYFDVMKDVLYAEGAGSTARRSAQTVLWHLLRHLVRLISPVLVHTAEETWEHLRAQGLEPDPADSVQLAAWLDAPEDWHDPDLAATWDQLFSFRSEAQKKIEEARAAKRIGHSYETAVAVRTRGELFTRLTEQAAWLPLFLVVSEVRVEEAAGAEPDLAVTVLPADGRKCERCWRVQTSVGRHADHVGLCDRCHTVVGQLPAGEARA